MDAFSFIVGGIFGFIVAILIEVMWEEVRIKQEDK